MKELFLFAIVNLLGAMSPGPDFAIVSRYGLSGSRKAALLAALGVTVALIVHSLYCLLGIGLFIQNSPLLFSLLRFVGSLYLGYLGVRLIFTAKKEEAESSQMYAKAFTNGFFTNLFNPNATLFLLGLFTQFITPATTTRMKFAYGIIIPIVAFLWFGFLSYMLTSEKLLPRLQRYQTAFRYMMGFLLLFLSLSCLLSLAI